ncbi:MAG: succinate dehydrogenase/fumarate reductase iron-sulfur subunit [Planctomycetes bacterium]|nr:succinate dehydrogenase/fumarate reductase iron-sulfur subunit [Planctomycetota bacterium]
MNTYQVRIVRSDEKGVSRGVETFSVALADRMTVLDALFSIQANQDPSLSFRCACRVGMCGTCAMTINAVPRLACKTQVGRLDSPSVTIAPLPNLPVVKDLVISLEPFFEQWKKIKPALHSEARDSNELARIPAGSPYARETPRKRDCITCGICYAACGVKATSGEYLGPAAINKAFLRILDPRDDATEERLDVINGERAGIWRCHTQFGCTAACPKKIDLTDTLVRLKRAMLFPSKLKKLKKKGVSKAVS